jgi:hypothetical protein
MMVFNQMMRIKMTVQHAIMSQRFGMTLVFPSMKASAFRAMLESFSIYE